MEADYLDESAPEYKEMKVATLPFPTKVSDQSMATARVITGFPPGGSPEEKGSWIPKVDEVWEMANKKYPDRMGRLFETLESSIGTNNPRHSLLKEFIPGTAEEGFILEALVGDYYTEKISSMFLHCFTEQKRKTESQYGTTHEATYVRLRNILTDENLTEQPNRFRKRTENSAKHSLHDTKSLQLFLLLNEILGSAASSRLNLTGAKMYAREIDLSRAHKELQSMDLLFSSGATAFNQLLSFTKEYDLDVEANSHSLAVPGRGVTDLSVKIEGTNSKQGKEQKVIEYPAIIEFKRPNAGFGIGWKFLNGHPWTKEEKKAFFELEELDRDPHTESILEKWQTNESDTWEAAERVFEQVGFNQSRFNRIDVEYRRVPKFEHLAPWYFINDRGHFTDISEDITTARFKTCLDNCYNGLAQVLRYATFKNCRRVAIADGLTFIAGVYKSSKPGENHHVLNADFDSTFMMQTHESDSALYFLNYLFNAATSSSRLMCLVYLIMWYAEGAPSGGEISQASKESLKEQLRGRRNVFDAAEHCLPIPSLQECIKLYTEKQKTTVRRFLAGLPKELSGLADHATSSDFVVCEWYRESNFDLYDSGEPTPGRSKSVAKVQLCRDTSGKHYVLKEYFGDDDSVARMKLELDAYCRAANLDDDDKKHVAELKAFGSLDLEDGIPRLFLLLEYVEEPERVPKESALSQRELTAVDNLLASVGVCHNDLCDRNYRWQRGTDGNWFIKVFDFDHATIKGPMLKREHSNIRLGESFINAKVGLDLPQLNTHTVR